MSLKVLMRLQPAGVFVLHFGPGTRADDFDFPARPKPAAEKLLRVLSPFIERSDTVHCAHHVPFRLNEYPTHVAQGALINILRELPVPLRALQRLALVERWTYTSVDHHLVATGNTQDAEWRNALSPDFLTGCRPNAWGSVVLTAASEVALLNYNHRGSGDVTALFGQTEAPSAPPATPPRW